MLCPRPVFRPATNLSGMPLAIGDIGSGANHLFVLPVFDKIRASLGLVACGHCGGKHAQDVFRQR